MKDYLVLVNKDNAFNEEENEFQYLKDIPVLRGDNGKNTSSLETETYNAFLITLLLLIFTTQLQLKN